MCPQPVAQGSLKCVVGIELQLRPIAFLEGVEALPLLFAERSSQVLEVTKRMMSSRDVEPEHQAGLGAPKRRLHAPAVVSDATSAYRHEMDIIGTFLTERCLVHASASVSAKHLYAAYRIWCDDNGNHPVSQRRFGSSLTERGRERKNRSNGVHYVGLGLVNDVNDYEPGFDKSALGASRVGENLQ